MFGVGGDGSSSAAIRDDRCFSVKKTVRSGESKDHNSVASMQREWGGRSNYKEERLKINKNIWNERDEKINGSSSIIETENFWLLLFFSLSHKFRIKSSFLSFSFISKEREREWGRWSREQGRCGFNQEARPFNFILCLPPPNILLR